MQMAYLLCDIFGVNPDEHITFIEDRPFNDARYAVDWQKITALGWKSHNSLITQISDIVQWYYDNVERYVPNVNADELNAPHSLASNVLQDTLKKAA
jgi:dTDP-D-glucose 4,6-dehydratase